MRKPPPRPDTSARRSDNNKRRLIAVPDPDVIKRLLCEVRYVGSSKHKANPHRFGLPPFLGERGDASLCDALAGFRPQDMEHIPRLLERSIEAGLLGKSQMIWTIGDNGWIYECRKTNPAQAEYHGYPVRASEPIAKLLFLRFKSWADQYGTNEDKQAAIRCRALYGFR